MSKPRSSSATIVPASAWSTTAPGCGTAATSSVPPSARIWNCSSKSPAGLDLHLVVDFGVDQLVEDLLVGVGLLRLAGAQQRSTVAGVLDRPPRRPAAGGVAVASPSSSSPPHAAASEREGEQRNEQSSLGTSHRILLVSPRWRCDRPADLGRRRRVAVPVDPGAVVGIEEVEAPRVHDELDRARPWRPSSAGSAGRHGGRAAGGLLLDMLERLLRRRRTRAPSCPRSSPAGRAIVKWTTTSDPSASRSSTVDVMRRSAGASATSAASSMSSGRMPRTTMRPLEPRRAGRCREHLRRGRTGGSRRTPPRARPVGASLASNRFIAGEPMNPATKRLTGCS